MFRREKVETIFKQAKQMDPHYKIFGTSKHQYRLNPSVDQIFIDEVERISFYAS